jgi:chitodextrinase/gamma-glutamylcyclotransferase (GGCT)/AIG2-like uncharacterized protein YtfP
MKRAQCSALKTSRSHRQYFQCLSTFLHSTSNDMKKIIRPVKRGCLLHFCSQLLVILMLLAVPATAGAVSVDLAWDAYNSSPDGYRIFVRSPDQGYDYSNPAWEGTTTQGTVDNLGNGETYYAVVRAFAGTAESGDSNEVEITTPAGTSPLPANQAPVADAGADQAVNGSANVVLNGTASLDADGSIAAYQWTQTGGQAVVLKTGDSAEASFTAPDVTSNTVLTFQLKVTDDQGDSAVDSCQVTVVPQTPADSSSGGSSGTSDSSTSNNSNSGGTGIDIRVNCGGGRYTDGAGNLWSADTGFNTGNTSATSSAIANTTDDTLYETERWDRYVAPDLAYSFSVPNGDYQVDLHFAEIYKGASFVGGRVFDVEIEGALVINALDIFAEVGANAALVETIPVTVSDGQLNIVFRQGVENPKVSAIEILGQGTVDDTAAPSVPIGLTGTAIGSSAIDLDWNDSSDTGGSGLAGYRVFRNGAQVGDVTGSSFSDTGLSAGTTYTYTVLAYDNAGNPSEQSGSINVGTPIGSVTTDVRVNCGGDQYTDGAGNIWSADTGFNTGNKGSTREAIANTTDDTLYRTERWDRYSAPDLAYSFDVPNGNYQVNLHFAEIYKGASLVGGRVFDVEIEGVLVINDLDIFAQAGANAALVETIPVTVSDGQLNIVFRHEVEDPKVSAIEILDLGTVDDTAAPSVPTGIMGTVIGSSVIDLDWNDSSDTGGSGLGGYRVFRNGVQVGDVTGSSFSDTGLSAGATYTYTVLAYDNAGNQSEQSGSIDVSTPGGTVATDIRVNCGGGQYTDGAGNVWAADTGFNTGKKGSTREAIANTTDDTLYKTERWDRYSAPDLAYSFDVPNGDYQVNLHFAEIYSGASFVGGRVFDVEIEGALVLDNLDIFAEVGANAALVETIPITVSDGKLNIVFRQGVENPKISAIEILSY